MNEIEGGLSPEIPHLRIMNLKPATTSATALWLSDLHLDQADRGKTGILLDQISGIAYGALVVTGDISNASQLPGHLRMLAAASAPRPMYFILGNHDYYDSSIGEVEGNVAAICRTVKNLHHLGGDEIIPLGSGVALIGHGGWADARAGYGRHTVIDSPDRHRIDDFLHLDRQAMLARMRTLGRDSAAIIRHTLPLALSRHRHVVIATHVPPFPETARYNGQRCGEAHLPHYTNLSAGLAIRGIARAFPKNFITILCGHAHSPVRMRILPNLEVRVGGAQTGNPAVQDLIRFAGGK